MQSANWVSAKNGLCVVQTTEINEFGTGSNYASGTDTLCERVLDTPGIYAIVPYLLIIPLNFNILFDILHLCS